LKISETFPKFSFFHLADSSTEFFEHPGFIAGVTIGSVVIVLLLLLVIALLCLYWFRHTHSGKKNLLGM